MKGSTKNRVRGKVRELKGKAKEKAGKLSGNPQLEDEGLDDQIIGKVQNVAGRIQKKLGD
ncbi:MAG TPA: CsbD family protein [Gemmatimonadales bacterium]|nr:CsbD family protein [Gemmatimonadales bacterium]